jgi:hypothetical protein
MSGGRHDYERARCVRLSITEPMLVMHLPDGINYTRRLVVTNESRQDVEEDCRAEWLERSRRFVFVFLSRPTASLYTIGLTIVIYPRNLCFVSHASYMAICSIYLLFPHGFE